MIVSHHAQKGSLDDGRVRSLSQASGSANIMLCSFQVPQEARVTRSALRQAPSGSISQAALFSAKDAAGLYVQFPMMTSIPPKYAGFAGVVGFIIIG